jgi:hypothetical protein
MRERIRFSDKARCTKIVVRKWTENQGERRWVIERLGLAVRSGVAVLHH